MGVSKTLFHSINSFLHFYILDLENQDINNSSKNSNQNKLKLLNQIEEQITGMKDGKTNFTLIMDDPASNSYLQVS